MEDKYPIIKKEGREVIIRVGIDEEGNPNPEDVKNIGDALKDHLEESKRRSILRIVMDLSPSYLSEIEIVGSFPKTSLIRILEKLVEDRFLITVGDDDERHAATEQAGAAANRQTIGRRPVKAEAWQDEIFTIEILPIVKTLTCEEVGIYRNGIVVRIFVKSYAEFQDQIICWCPLILKIEAIDSQFEVGFGIYRYPRVGTAVEHEVNNSVLQIVERTKHIITLRERQEQIANRIFFLFPPGSQRVIAD